MSDDELNDGDLNDGDLNDNEQTRKDMSYSPASGRETERMQHDGTDSPALDDPDIDPSRVNALPGTGGPDDVGDIEFDPDELDRARRAASGDGAGGRAD
jgi:hypothetical protein